MGCSCLIVLDRQDSPTCCWLSSSCLKGPTGPSGPCVPLVSWLSLAGALCPPGFGLCTPGLLGPSPARGSSGDSMIPAHPPARRLAAARALASRQWFRARRLAASLRRGSQCSSLRNGGGWDFAQRLHPRWLHMPPHLVQGLFALLQGCQGGLLFLGDFSQFYRPLPPFCCLARGPSGCHPF